MTQFAASFSYLFILFIFIPNTLQSYLVDLTQISYCEFYALQNLQQSSIWGIKAASIWNK